MREEFDGLTGSKPYKEPPRRQAAMDTDDSIPASTIDGVPDKRHLDAVEFYTRMVSLHFARAHAVVERFENDLRERALGGVAVQWDTPLAEAAGDGDVVREVNAFEGANIVTVGEFLSAFDESPDYLLSIPNIGVKSIAMMLAAVLTKALGR